MSFSDIFKKGFLNSYANSEITFQFAVTAMLISAVLSALICVVYYLKSRKYFFSKEFASSLVAMAIITTAVILTIQSSIVVSLGMVGALSIVRFRTAIKNPLDLVFMFWSITIGIICGSGLYYIAVGVSLIVGIVVLVSDAVPGLSRNKILVLDGSYPYNTDDLKEILKKNTRFWRIRTESVHNDDVNLIIEVRGVKDPSVLIKEIREMKAFHSVSLIVQEGEID